jgi:hypothetical protein
MSSPPAPRPAPGEARAASASTQQILHRDGRPVPVAYEEESYRFLGDVDIDFNRYTSRAFFEREIESM